MPVHSSGRGSPSTGRAPPLIASVLLREPQAAYGIAGHLRALFREIRWCFPVSTQPRVYSIIDEQLSAVAERFAQDPELVFALTGHRMSCRVGAQGSPLRTAARPDGYCPSHRHLADEVVGIPDYVLAGYPSAGA